MNIDEQLKLILKFGEGASFLSFANADGKRWLMPARNMRTAMNLYQPSGPKGKLVKAGLPWLYWNPVVCRVLHAKRMRLALSDELRILLERILGEKNLEFSVFCGTPCVHQKITMQINRGSRILGYVKVTTSEDIFAVFKHENRILSTLRAQGIEHIPEPLYCGTLECGIHVFVQTTIKTAKSKVVHEWTLLHSRFLDKLAECSRQTLDFEQTDFCQDLSILENRLSQLDEAAPVAQTMAEVRSCYMGREVQFSAFQADFTPWNMFVEKGNLFVFDWEYARLSYPPRLDYFHYKIQTAIFERHLTVDEILRDIEAERSVSNFTHDDWTLSLKCYLLAIISLYINREKGPISSDTRERIALWVKMLKLLEN